MKLHPIEKQVILYTKLHFKRFDYENDLKYFAAELYELGIEQVENYSIVHMVTTLHQKLVDRGYLTFDHYEFTQEVFKIAWRNKGKSEINQFDLIEAMLIDIQNMQIKFDDCPKLNIDLGDPDYTILPITASEKSS